MINEEIRDLCSKIPKVELHAHLNGSLSINTLRKLQNFKNPCSNDKTATMAIENQVTLKDCFKLFDIAHEVTNTPEAVFIATCDVIKEFMEDNVIYLELRSTPRKVEGLMTKRQYIEAILRGIEKCEINYPNILVKLLISIDRRKGHVEAKENVELALLLRNFHPRHIVGIDLSGDPTRGDGIVDLLETAKKAGLKIAVHCGEIPNEKEVIDILNFKPDRLGHCTCIHPKLGGSNALFRMLLDSKIPTEICLTSNVKSKTVPSYSDHHFGYLFKMGHPICIATDDKGVFDTTLSQEFEIACHTFKLSRSDVKSLCESGVKYSFATDVEREFLLSHINNFH